MVDAGESVSAALKREFTEEAFNSLEMNEKMKADLEESIKQIFASGGKLIYKG